MALLQTENSPYIGFKSHHYVKLNFPKSESTTAEDAVLNLFDINNVNGKFVAAEGTYIIVDDIENLHSTINNSDRDDGEEIINFKSSNVFNVGREIEFVKLLSNKLVLGTSGAVVVVVKDLNDLNEDSFKESIFEVGASQIFDMDVQKSTEILAVLTVDNSLKWIDLNASVYLPEEVQSGVSAFEWSSFFPYELYFASKSNKQSEIVKYNVNSKRQSIAPIAHPSIINEALYPISLKEVNDKHLTVVYDISGRYEDNENYEGLEIKCPRYSSYLLNVNTKAIKLIDEEFCSNADYIERDFKSYALRLKNWGFEKNTEHDDLIIMTTTVGTFVSILKSDKHIVPLEDDRRAPMPMDPQTFDDVQVCGTGIDFLNNEQQVEVPGVEDPVSGLPLVWLYTTMGTLVSFEFFDIEALRNNYEYVKNEYQVNKLKQQEASAASNSNSYSNTGARSTNGSINGLGNLSLGSTNSFSQQKSSPISSAPSNGLFGNGLASTTENPFSSNSDSSNKTISPFGRSNEKVNPFSSGSSGSGKGTSIFGLGNQLTSNGKPVSGADFSKSNAANGGSFGQSGFANASKDSKPLFGNLNIGTTSNSNSSNHMNSNESGFGSSGFGSSGFGSSGFGSSGFGNASLGSAGSNNSSSAFGNAGFGGSSFGNSFLSNNNTKNTGPGFGQAAFGKSSFGQPSFGQSAAAAKPGSGLTGIPVTGSSTNMSGGGFAAFASKPAVLGGTKLGVSNGQQDASKDKETTQKSQGFYGSDSKNGSLFTNSNELVADASTSTAKISFGESPFANLGSKKESPFANLGSKKEESPFANLGSKKEESPFANLGSKKEESPFANLGSKKEESPFANRKSSLFGGTSWDSNDKPDVFDAADASESEGEQESTGDEDGALEREEEEEEEGEEEKQQYSKQQESETPLGISSGFGGFGTAVSVHSEDEKSKELRNGFIKADNKVDTDEADFKSSHHNDLEDSTTVSTEEIQDNKLVAGKEQGEVSTASATTESQEEDGTPSENSVEDHNKSLQATKSYTDAGAETVRPVYKDAEVEATKKYVDQGIDIPVKNYKNANVQAFENDEDYLQQVRLSKSDPILYQLEKVAYPSTISRKNSISSKLDKFYYDSIAEYQVLESNSKELNDFIKDHLEVRNKLGDRRTTLKNIYTWRLEETPLLTQLIDNKYDPQVNALSSKFQNLANQIDTFKGGEYSQFIKKFEDFAKDFSTVEINSKLISNSNINERVLPYEFMMLQQNVKSKFNRACALYDELQEKMLQMKSNYEISYSSGNSKSSSNGCGPYYHNSNNNNNAASTYAKFQAVTNKIEAKIKKQMTELAGLLKEVNEIKLYKESARQLSKGSDAETSSLADDVQELLLLDNNIKSDKTWQENQRRKELNSSAIGDLSLKLSNKMEVLSSFNNADTEDITTTFAL